MGFGWLCAAIGAGPGVCEIAGLNIRGAAAAGNGAAVGCDCCCICDGKMSGPFVGDGC